MCSPAPCPTSAATGGTRPFTSGALRVPRAGGRSSSGCRRRPASLLQTAAAPFTSGRVLACGRRGRALDERSPKHPAETYDVPVHRPPLLPRTRCITSGAEMGCLGLLLEG